MLLENKIEQLSNLGVGKNSQQKHESTDLKRKKLYLRLHQN